VTRPGLLSSVATCRTQAAMAAATSGSNCEPEHSWRISSALGICPTRLRPARMLWLAWHCL